MTLAHKIALDPTDAKAAGCARFTWNLALAEWNRRHEAGEKPKAAEIKADFNAFKYEAFPWMNEIHRDCHAQPFANLQKAFVGFFKKIGAHPKFHKKGRKDSFYIANDKLSVEVGRIRIPVIGWVRLREELRYCGKIESATVSRTADRWFVSIQVDVGDCKKARTGDDAVGVDLGITSAITVSTGEKIDGPKPLKKELRRLRRIQRKASRHVKGSKNQKKTYRKVARIHVRVANIRKDFWHKVTTRLCRENQAIAIEDLNVRGMLKNRKLSRALDDVAIGMMRPMLEYKSKIYGNQIVVVDRWFPSSKTCSACGCVKESLKLKERTFECESCDVILDRDVNAAINLRNKIPEALGKSMSADWERLGKAPCEAETTMLATRQQAAHLCAL